ncbi:NAD(P)H-hydrate dehydratase [Sphingomonas sp. Leaf25]|uniref:NAD(P)H-hydrate dehydratase n=1 Tax=Sphingomonas sp. Leaf25 TaxID=1735692 RepID=UPI000AAC4D35|nr:NAD(P)H-hydrate dehydratase [Sphingomonas sp. Leaf25]
MNRLPSAAPILSAAAMRDAEAAAFAAGVDQDDLMERAGLAVAQMVQRVAMGREVLVLAGPGNNGGDAFVVARLLHQWGHDVTVAALPGSGEGSAAQMRARWRGRTTPLAEAPPGAVVVDGLFGTGLNRPLVAEVAAPLAALIVAAETVVAIDVPSGCDADARQDLSGAARADVTVALGALKPVHSADLARCGTVVLADLGIDLPDAIRTIARPVIAAPQADAHKYRRGLVAVLGGAMPGAARLAARAALSGGAGYVVLAGEGMPGEPDALVHRPVDSDAALAELVGDDRLAALLVGPGLGRDAAAWRLIDAAMASSAPLVLDGDALSLLGSDGVGRIVQRRGPTWLTPHAGEFSRMFPERSGNKLEMTIAAAKAARATIVHKGPDTVIATPDGRAVVAAGASSWLSTAGTGDVLAGILAARLRPGQAAAAEQAVWLHGRAARLAGPAFVADALIDHLPAAISECR